MTPEQRRARQQRAAAIRAVRSGSSSPSSEVRATNPTQRTGLKSSLWTRLSKQIVARDFGVCHACRAMGCHGTGADGADHHPVPRSECEARGVSLYDPGNLKAIHSKAPCQWCGVNCNRVKAAGSMDAFRLKWQAKTGRVATEPRPAEPEEDRW